MVARYVENFYQWKLTVLYKSVKIISPHDNLPSIIYFRQDDRHNAEELVDLLAFLIRTPLLINLKRRKLNDETIEVIEAIRSKEDFIRILKKIYQKKETLSITPIMNPFILALYNSSLKQIDPLAKCVFLFRIVEYSALQIDKHQGSLASYSEAILTKALKHNFIPVNIADWTVKRNINVMNRDLRRAKKIIKDLKKSRINIGEEIYINGRCGIAHAGRKNQPTILHDYSTSFERIKRINILLDVICRYLIEKQNPAVSKDLNQFWN